MSLSAPHICYETHLYVQKLSQKQLQNSLNLLKLYPFHVQTKIYQGWHT